MEFIHFSPSDSLKPYVSEGRHTMLGIRFLTHSAAFFLNEEIGLFNDRVSDLTDIMGNPVKNVHFQLLEKREPAGYEYAGELAKTITGDKNFFSILS